MRFLHPPLLKEALTITSVLDTQVWESRMDFSKLDSRIQELDPRDEKRLLDFLKYIHPEKNREQLKHLCHSEIEGAILEIVNFWVQELCNYILIRNRTVYLLNLIKDFPKIPADAQTDIRRANYFFGEGNLQISPQCLAASNEVLFTDNPDEFRGFEINTIPRKVLVHIPDTVLNWSEKQQFAQNMEALHNLHLLEKLDLSGLRKCCLPDPDAMYLPGSDSYD